jgi:hypothetical protein
MTSQSLRFIPKLYRLLTLDALSSILETNDGYLVMLTL